MTREDILEPQAAISLPSRRLSEGVKSRAEDQGIISRAERQHQAKMRSRRREINASKRFLCKLGSPLSVRHQANRVIALFILLLLFQLDCCYFYRSQSAQAIEAVAATERAYSPRITIQPNDLIAVEGESTELNCDADGEPQPSIEWYHNGQLIKASSQTRTTMGGSIQFLDIRPSSSSLSASSLVQPATVSDAGVYHCLARNSLGQERSRNASLQVACKYRVSSSPEEE